jgi:anthranilate phosphoribosyltransferase
MNEITKITNKIINKQNITIYEAHRAMQIISKNGATPSQIAAYITALSTKGIVADEIIGTLNALQHYLPPIEHNLSDTIFIRSTGYENPPCLKIPNQANSIINNIPNLTLPTAAILRAAGMKVIISSNISDHFYSTSHILENIGYDLSLNIEAYYNILDKSGLVFVPDKLYSPKMLDFHFVAKELDFLNIVDLTLPFLSPIKADFHYYGLYKGDICNIILEAMHLAEIKNGCVIHNNLGYDKIIAEENNSVSYYNDIKNNHFDYYYSILNKNISDWQKNYDCKNFILEDALLGQKNLYHHLIIANAAPALLFCNKAENIIEAENIASNLLLNKQAYHAMRNMISSS